MYYYYYKHYLIIIKGKNVCSKKFELYHGNCPLEGNQRL